jgi:uncharacterized membrane protein (UPF0127 family)
MIRIIETGCVISRCPLYADSFFQRLTGMLTRKFSDTLDCIVFRSCNAVHTFGMRFDIDVLFVTQDNRIAATYPKVKPWKTCGIKCRRATAVELPAGSIYKYSISVGDFVEFN